MTLLNLITGEYPCSLWQVRQANPNVSFPDDLAIADLTPFGYAKVTATPQPTPDPRTERLENPTVEPDGAGGYRQRWTIRNATAEELAAYDEANRLAPDWPGFQTQLLQSEAFAAARIGARQILEDELPTAEGVRRQRLLRAATALSDIGAVVLAAASQNDSSLFIGAWLILRQANLVSPEVAAGMAQIATAYHLPSELILSLGVPDQLA
jgi:hypothetical protein